MNNKLIKTNTIWYKIKKFFNKIFTRKSPNFKNELSEKNIVKEQNVLSVTLQEEMAENNRKEYLAKRLLNGELGSGDLTDTEVDEMTQYFKRDIQELDSELNQIKQHILQMRKQLDN